MKKYMYLAFPLLLCGCSLNRNLEPPILATPSEPPSQCEGIFVLAPNSIDPLLIENDLVLLSSEGRYSDLPVYCTLNEAQNQMQTMITKKRLIPDILDVYKLDGVWEQDVTEIQPGQWRMRRPAELNKV